MSRLQQYLHNFITSGGEEHVPFYDRGKVKFLNGFLCITVVGGFCLGIADFLRGQYQYVVLDILVIILFSGGLVFFRITKNIHLISSIMLLISLAFLLYTHIFEAISLDKYATSATSLNVFPPLAFFLTGKRRGVFWSIFLLFCVLVIYLISKLGFLPGIYSSSSIIYVFNYSLICFFVYFYQSVVEKNQETITTKLTEIESLNRLMLDRELKMIELKKEIVQLKGGEHNTVSAGSITS